MTLSKLLKQGHFIITPLKTFSKSIHLKICLLANMDQINVKRAFTFL